MSEMALYLKLWKKCFLKYDCACIYVNSWSAESQEDKPLKADLCTV